MLRFLSKLWRRPWVRQGAKIIFSAALLGYCLTLVDLTELPKILSNCEIHLVAIAFVFTLLGTICAKAAIVWILLPKSNQVTFWSLTLLNLALRFYTMILPKAIVAGIRWNKYRKLSDAQTSLVILSFETLVALFTATICALAFMYAEDTLVVPPHLKIVTLLLLTAFVAIAGLLFLFPNSKTLSLIQDTLNKFRASRFVGKMVEKWRSSVVELKLQQRSTLYPVFLISLLGHLTFVLGGYILFQALGTDVSFTAVAWIRSAVFVLVSVPISFAGIGIRELGFIYLFGMYGIDSNEILVYAILALFVQASIAALGFVVEVKNWLVEK